MVDGGMVDGGFGTVDRVTVGGGTVDGGMLAQEC